ncbi:hypothetical protein G3N95_15315 [Paraburkholderia sp. Tr-20389]|uniref:hypothetical protein n=1 Tax=Paraburkholderia sp. Tr-20389 TaxID=2703903 RepID=UPI001981B879|nr:hypothetical protein [Paraburkholderia sp. Tr-20389]MBN3754321.1 hypothetical protein [Paraburkholderia sp. Tr-20389]
MPGNSPCLVALLAIASIDLVRYFVVALAHIDMQTELTHAAADPLRLAALYHAGNGIHWSSYRQAAVVLSEKLKVKVGFARIREAVAVSELPTEILAIFSEVGIVNKTARELLKAAKAHGVSSLVERARTLDPLGKSRAQLSAHVCGKRGLVGPKQQYLPLLLADTYREGIANGRWVSMTGAASHLGVHRETIARAKAIASLPGELLDLFPGISAEMGDRLVGLAKVRGMKKMRALAIEAASVIPRLSQDELVGHLVGLARNTASVKLDRSGGNLILTYNLGPVDDNVEIRLAMMAAILNAGGVVKPR